MTREELSKFIVQILKDENKNSDLVNFMDDEVNWELIVNVIFAVLVSKYGKGPWELQ